MKQIRCTLICIQNFTILFCSHITMMKMLRKRPGEGWCQVCYCCVSPSLSCTRFCSAVDLESGLVALQAAVDLMSNNKYHEAVRLLKPKSVPLSGTLNWGHTSSLESPLVPPPKTRNVARPVIWGFPLRAETSMYHSMAYGTVLFLQAVFCVERVRGVCVWMCGLYNVLWRTVWVEVSKLQS